MEPKMLYTTQASADPKMETIGTNVMIKIWK